MITYVFLKYLENFGLTLNFAVIYREICYFHENYSTF